jgi:putative copper export protein
MWNAGIISEAFLYLCFSLLVGSFLICMVPETARPKVTIPKSILLLASLGIAVFSFLPVLKIVLYLYKDLGLGYTIQSVLTNFEVGKSWMTTGILSLILFIYLIPIKIERKPLFALNGLVFTLILIAALGWSSHASSLSKWAGFVIHSLHFLAVTTWVGILIIVSWFSRNHENWQRFLKWFSPVALFCLLITVLTGLSLMTFHMQLSEYVSVTAISYGQTLLIKHLAILPLLAFAAINSILIRKRLQNDVTFNPIPWAKLESIIVLLVFSITGALGQASPPHELNTMVKAEDTSRLFTYFHPGEIVFPLEFSLGVGSVSLIFLALFFLGLLVFTFIKQAPKILTLVMSFLFILTGYLAFMFGVS